MNTEELYKVINVDFKVWSKWSKEEKEVQNKKEQEAVIKWKEWLFKKYEVSENPKKDLCYSKAYEMGHSSGFNEIEIYFSDLVDLIKKE
jgi:hypothetical protein